jgi:alanine racemase
MEPGEQIEITENGNTMQKNNCSRLPATSRQTWVEIDLGALKENYSKLCSLLRDGGPETSASGASRRPRIIPVIKANAYGHGALQAASTLSEAGARIFAVGIVEEGVSLRQSGITQDILVMGTSWRGQEKLALEHRLILSLDSTVNLELLDAAAAALSAPAPVHLKVDTGMGRLGCRWNSFEDLLGGLKQSRNLSLEGVFSHLASADEEDPAYTQLQKTRFEHSLSLVEKAGLRPKEVHFPNSAGMLYHESFRQWSCRTGIALYGYAPGERPSSLNLRPALSFKTRIGPIREAQKGESIGYGRRFIASRTTRYATLPVGYADGFPRGLSGNCRVIIRDRWVEVIGTVSMDMIAVDLTGRPDIREGDEVILIGSGGSCSITADAWARKLGTIPYEILCGIAARVPRIYI